MWEDNLRRLVESRPQTSRNGTGLVGVRGMRPELYSFITSRLTGWDTLCRRGILDGWRSRGQLHRSMERHQLVGPWLGHERGRHLPGDFRARTCMREAGST